jgi:electron transport complex protein RnfE
MQPPPATPSLSITWQQSTFLLPLFCLCPLLAASSSLAIAISYSVVMMMATFSTMIVMLATRCFINSTNHSMIALICSSMIIAILELLLHAWNFELFRALSLFLPLAVIACLLITRTEMQEPQASLTIMLWRAVKMNGGFLFAAVILGTAREIIGHGTLLYDAATLWGSSWQPFSVTLFQSDMGFLLAILAPGAFIGFGIGVAIYNWVWLHLPHKHPDNNIQ